MADDAEIERFTGLFRKLGARDPASWARSHVLEPHLNQLGRFLFLRQAWKLVVSEDEPGWVDSRAAGADPDSDRPYSSTYLAANALRAKGATNEELTDLVRGMQAELLFGLLYRLGDPDLNDDTDLKAAGIDMSWGLFQVDDAGEPGVSISGLHESMLDTDPTGREMRPRPKPKKP
jgi:hypothetical protein